MADTLTLVEPLPAPHTFRVARILFDVAGSNIQIVVSEASAGVLLEDGKTYEAQYVGPEAETLMQSLNTANLSTGNSLQKRILNKLTADGKIPAGTVD